jgi:hypothetical protein
MIVDGERLSGREVRRLIAFFDRECKEAAAEFFDRCRKGLMGDAGRSEKFRTFWSEIGLRCGRDPQDCYVASHYTNFAEDVRRAMAGLLARRDVSEKDKQDIHRALIIQQMLGMHSQHVPVQLARDSQQFAGDPVEVRQMATTYGNHADPAQLRRALLNSTATRH